MIKGLLVKDLLLFEDIRGEDIVTSEDILRIQRIEAATGQLTLFQTVNE